MLRTLFRTMGAFPRRWRQTRSISMSSIRFSKKLSDQIDEQFCQRLASTDLSHEVKVLSLKKEIMFWEERSFPLPQKLTDEQWRNVLSFNYRESRLFYLDSIVKGQEDVQSMKKFDDNYNMPLRVPEKFKDNPLHVDALKQVVYASECLRHEGYIMPEHLVDMDWVSLLEMTSLNEVMNQLRFIAQNRRSQKLLDFIKKRALEVYGEAKKKDVIEKRASESHIVYGLGHNTIFMRINDQSIDKFDTACVLWNTHPSWEQPLVIDLQFVKSLTQKNVYSLFYREIAFALNYNKRFKEPFSIYLVNYDPKCKKCGHLGAAIKNAFNHNGTAIITEKSYVDLFDKRRLVYMSPDSKTDLWLYDPNDVYIVGAIVDKQDMKPYSLSAAKRDGIRCARLPMKNVVNVKASLNVEHMVTILHDFKQTQNWFYSFRWIPSRYFKNKLHSANYTELMEREYLAHLALGPDNEPNITCKEYHQKYKQIVGAPKDPSFVCDPQKYARRQPDYNQS